MLHNIFKKTPSKKPQALPTIIADIHEKNSLVIAQLKNSGQVNLKLESLKVADYITGSVAIERKTISDLINSMINKRLHEQLDQMKQYEKSLLIIEGDLQEILDKEDNLAKAVRGFLIATALYKTPLIQTRDYKETANYLITLAKQQTNKKTPPSLHARIPKTKEEQKKYIIQAFPSIGPKKAEQLLNKFKTLKNIFSASSQELQEVLKSQTTAFKDLLDT